MMDTTTCQVNRDALQMRQGWCWSLRIHLLCFHVVAFLTGLSSHGNGDNNGDATNDTGGMWILLQTVLVGGTLMYAVYLHWRFPIMGHFGTGPTSFSRHDSNDKADGLNDELRDWVASSNYTHVDDDNQVPFEAPLVPLLPLLGNFLNWYLITQLDWSGIVLLLIFLGLISSLYAACIKGRPRALPRNDYTYNPLQDDDSVKKNDIEGPSAKK